MSKSVDPCYRYCLFVLVNKYFYLHFYNVSVLCYNASRVPMTNDEIVSSSPLVVSDRDSILVKKVLNMFLILSTKDLTLSLAVSILDLIRDTPPSIRDLIRLTPSSILD